MNRLLARLTLAYLLVVIGCATRRPSSDDQIAPPVSNDQAKSIEGAATPNNVPESPEMPPDNSVISDVEAIEIARRYYGIKTDSSTSAKFTVKKMKDGYRVYAVFGTLDDAGELRSYPGGSGALTISSSGEIIDVFRGA